MWDRGQCRNHEGDRKYEVNDIQEEGTLFVSSTSCIKVIFYKASDWNLPFFQIMQANKKFEGTSYCEWDLQEIKKHIYSLPILTNLILGDPLFLHLSISNVAVNAVLVKEMANAQLVIYYITNLYT